MERKKQYEVRNVPGRRQGRAAGKVLGKRERQRLGQLAVCLTLFLAVFLGRDVPGLSRLREEIHDAVFGTMDTGAVLTDLGWSLTADRPLREAVDTLWNGLFAPEEAALVNGPAGLVGPGLERELSAMSKGEATLLVQCVAPQLPPDPMLASGARPEPTPQPPPPEPEVIHMDYTGPALPDNATMDRYSLGLKETVTPVMGVLASGFGWREHPIDGGQKFHQGVDLDVPTGTDVLAFADGVVDYIGESDIYGKYLQLRHEGGITTFYCHCSRLLVGEGTAVTAGQPVAQVGATGRVTGPHLHFELRRNGVLLQPLYYIDTLT